MDLAKKTRLTAPPSTSKEARFHLAFRFADRAFLFAGVGFASVAVTMAMPARLASRWTIELRRLDERRGWRRAPGQGRRRGREVGGKLGPLRHGAARREVGNLDGGQLVNVHVQRDDVAVAVRLALARSKTRVKC